MTAEPKPILAMTAAELAAHLAREIPQRVDDAKRANLRVWPANFNNASEVGHDCERYLVYRRTQSDQQRLPDVGLQYAADEGHLHHINMRRTLEDLGYTLGDVEVSFTWKEKQMRGRIDGIITGDRAGRFPLSLPFDFKSVSTHLFGRINTLANLAEGRWTRKYLAQMTAYCLMTEREAGLFILKNRDNGRYKAIPMALDYDFAEDLLQKVERINVHVAARSLPDRIPYDDDHCGSCSFRDTCLPDVDSEAWEFDFDDVGLAAHLDRLAQLKPLSKEYKEINEHVRLKLERCHRDKGRTRTLVVGGRWKVLTEYSIRNERMRMGGLREVFSVDIGPISARKNK